METGGTPLKAPLTMARQGRAGDRFPHPTCRKGQAGLQVTRRRPRDGDDVSPGRRSVLARTRRMCPSELDAVPQPVGKFDLAVLAPVSCEVQPAGTRAMSCEGWKEAESRSPRGAAKFVVP